MNESQIEDILMRDPDMTIVARLKVDPDFAIALYHEQRKRIGELEQSYAAGLEAKCPHTLRRAVIDGLNERIAELEGALEDIAGYATIETPEVVMEIISGMLNKD